MKYKTNHRNAYPKWAWALAEKLKHKQWNETDKKIIDTIIKGEGNESKKTS